MLCDTQGIDVALLYVYLETDKNGWNFSLSVGSGFFSLQCAWSDFPL